MEVLMPAQRILTPSAESTPQSVGVGALGVDRGAVEVLLSVIDRLTSRVVELEAWKVQAEREFVTQKLLARERIQTASLTVTSSEFDPKITLAVDCERAEVRLTGGDGDDDPLISLETRRSGEYTAAAVNVGAGRKDEAPFAAITAERTSIETVTSLWMQAGNRSHSEVVELDGPVDEVA
jgi:hypothetical protein